jgi:hypothetical protein
MRSLPPKAAEAPISSLLSRTLINVSDEYRKDRVQPDLISLTLPVTAKEQR